MNNRDKRLAYEAQRRALGLCCRETQPVSVYQVNHVCATDGYCSRKAAYIDDAEFLFCKQHAKIPATTMAKAKNKIRPGCRLIESEPSS